MSAMEHVIRGFSGPFALVEAVWNCDSRMLVALLASRRHEHERVVHEVHLVRAHRAGVELGRCRP